LKKIIAIFFLSIFLCANTEIGQLLKLPTLVQHYFEHRNNKNDDELGISFISFLKNHYNQNSHHASDAKHSHKNLPFKTCNCQSFNTMMVLLQQPIFLLHHTAIISIIQITFYAEQHYTSKSFGSIWQPPKLG
jgi:hypothetical protein